MIREDLLKQLNELIATLKTAYDMQYYDCTQDCQLPGIISNLRKKVSDIQEKLRALNNGV